MIALFDSGSSYLHFGWFDNGLVSDTASIPYPDSTRELDAVISDLLGGRTPECAAACSVNSLWRESVFKTINRHVPRKLHIAVDASDINLIVNYDQPSHYGIDRALAAHAAHSIFRNSCVVVDAGTAITIDAVAEDGSIMGGYIFPGGQTLLHGLTEKTTLPPVSIDYDNTGLGASTEQCISYGISIGITGAIIRLIEHAAGYVSCSERVILTGGEAESLMKMLPLHMILRPHLVLEGLGLTAEKLPKYS